MRFLSFAASLLVAFAAPAVAQSVPLPVVPMTLPAPMLETPESARTRDAAEYARQFAVPLAEADRRLAAQEDSVASTDRLAETWRDRLAGIVIEHSPRWQIVVYLTGSEPVAEQRIRAGAMSVPVVFRPGALTTRDRVIYALTYYQAAISAAVIDGGRLGAPSMGYDPRRGALVVIVGAHRVPRGPDPLQAKLEAIAHVPVEIRVLERTDVNLAPAGGGRVIGTSPDDGKRYVCTTGFVVTDGTRSAVTTAAHCLDTLSYAEAGSTLPLDFIGQWGWGYRDVQINASTAALAPAFFADTAKTRLRPVTGMRTRAATRPGDFVCHRGERTGYSCALVELTDFAPAGALCGGACLPTWVTVAGPTCKGGDSGSPVFSGTTAFGIVKGGSYRGDGACVFYFYMSVDYLPAGWALAFAPPSAGMTAPGAAATTLR